MIHRLRRPGGGQARAPAIRRAKDAMIHRRRRPANGVLAKGPALLLETDRNDSLYFGKRS